MAKLSQIKTGEAFVKRLDALGSNADKVAEAALKAGAGVVADEIRGGMATLPERTGVTKRGLQSGLGISPVRAAGGRSSYDVKVGFDGYNERGEPNMMMARIMESGTSRTKKHPFIRPAVRRSQDRAVAAMDEAFDEECEKIMKG